MSHQSIISHYSAVWKCESFNKKTHCHQFNEINTFSILKIVFLNSIYHLHFKRDFKLKNPAVYNLISSPATRFFKRIKKFIKCWLWKPLNFWFADFPVAKLQSELFRLFSAADVPKRIAPKKGKNNTEIKHHSKVFCLIML